MCAPQATKISMCERAAGEENTIRIQFSKARRRRGNFTMGAPQARKIFDVRAAGEENFLKIFDEMCG